MARSLLPGPDWVPSIIKQFWVQLLFVVETEEGLHWKRHADQLKITPVSLEDQNKVSDDTQDSVVEDLPVEISMVLAGTASNETA